MPAGNEAPVAFIANGTSSSIQILGMGQQLPLSVGNAIGAGPNLVSWDPRSKQSITYIPDTDFNVNIWAHEANTAVGLIGNATTGFYEQVVMVTADGDDGCDRSDPTCGIEAKPMAYFMKDYVKVRPPSLVLPCLLGVLHVFICFSLVSRLRWRWRWTKAAARRCGLKASRTMAS